MKLTVLQPQTADEVLLQGLLLQARPTMALLIGLEEELKELKRLACRLALRSTSWLMMPLSHPVSCLRSHQAGRRSGLSRSRICPAFMSALAPRPA